MKSKALRNKAEVVSERGQTQKMGAKGNPHTATTELHLQHASNIVLRV